MNMRLPSMAGNARRRSLGSLLAAGLFAASFAMTWGADRCAAFDRYLGELGYPWVDETGNEAYRLFLR